MQTINARKNKKIFYLNYLIILGGSYIMQKRFILVLLTVCVLSLSLCFNVSAKTAAETFILFIEAEDCVMDGYTIVDGNAGAVGKMITTDTPNEQFFTVNFTVPADGRYTVWFKVWHTSQGDNSVFFELDGEEHVFDFDENAGADDLEYFMLNRWYWAEICKRGSEPLQNGWSEWGEANNQCRHTPIELNLKAGANSMTFKSREAGHFIDQIIITDNLDYNPADVPGNSTYVCTFCNLNHFRLEPYADFGKTPQQYWEERLIAEAPPPPEPEQPAAPENTQDQAAADEPAPPPTPAPQAPPTSDMPGVAFALLLIAALSAALLVKFAKKAKNN